MKATIDGFALEGTPEEINEFKKLRDTINEQEAWKKLNALRTHPNTIGSDSVDAISKGEYTYDVTKNPYTVTLDSK